MVTAPKESFRVNEKSDVPHSDKLIRHVVFARILHWVMALCILSLLASAYLPVFGANISWVTFHWVTGIVLTIAISIHIIWSLCPGRLRQMLFWIRDLKDTFATLTWFFRLRVKMPDKPGKYSPAQKMIHHGFSLVILTAVVTGLMMMVKIDTPFWERDPYWLSSKAWGIIYVLHDAASMLLVTMIMLHVYFAFRPEKRLYLRSMIKGWITRDEYTSHHDQKRWEK